MGHTSNLTNNTTTMAVRYQGGKAVGANQQYTLPPGFYLFGPSGNRDGVVQTGGLAKVEGSTIYYWIPSEHRFGALSGFAYMNDPQNPYMTRSQETIRGMKRISADQANKIMGADLVGEVQTTVGEAAVAMAKARWPSGMRVMIKLIK